ncbi:MAG: hypothetical protein WAN87_09390 [Thermoplasmata archaeon]
MALFQRKSVEPVVVHTVRSVEIPTITLLKSQMANGSLAAAMSTAFRAVVRDVERAFRLSIPTGWTDREIVTQWGVVRTNSPAATRSFVPAELRDMVLRLYAMYEPVRFGPPGTPLRGDPVAVLQSIYTFPPMWRLYIGPLGPLEPAPGEKAPDGPKEPVASADEEGD